MSNAIKITGFIPGPQIQPIIDSTTNSTTALGGDVTGGGGTSPGGTTVTGIQGIPVSATPPTTGQELVFDGTEWAPTTEAPGGLSSVTDGTTTVSPASSLQVPNQSLEDGGSGLAIVRWDRLLTIAASGAAQTLNLSLYDAFDITLTANCTLTFSNPPTSGVDRVWTFIIRQGGSGSYTLTWPAAVSWPAANGTPTATPPALFTVVTAVNVVVMDTLDGGTTYGANLIGSGGSVSPLTTKGDLYTYSTANARLGVGGTYHGLVADPTQATGLRWTINAMSGEQLVEDGATNPPVTLTTEAQDDWIYADV